MPVVDRTSAARRERMFGLPSLSCLSVMSAPDRIANGEKDAARFVTEPGDGPAGHAAGEIEMTEGALDAAIHARRYLVRHGQRHAGDTLPAPSYAFIVIDGRRILRRHPEIVAPLNLVQADAAADKGRDGRFGLEIIKPIEHHRIVPGGADPGIGVVEGSHPGDTAAIISFGAQAERAFVADRGGTGP